MPVTLTFNQDLTFVDVTNQSTFSGDYTYADGTVELTYDVGPKSTGQVSAEGTELNMDGCTLTRQAD